MYILAYTTMYRPLTFRDLRRTYGTMMVYSRAADPEVLAAQMGHTDPSITYKTYAVPYEHAKMEAAATYDELLAKLMTRPSGKE